MPARHASGRSFTAQLAFQHFQLEIEAQHDVEIVGHLVGVGADERARDLVDGAVEGVERHVARAGPGKRSAAADRNSSQKPRLRATTIFSHSRDWLSCTPAETPWPSGVPSSAGVDALLVHGVPGLVQRRKQRVAEVVFAHAGGDAHVARGEFRAERMMREVEPAAREVVAHALARPLRPNSNCAGSAKSRCRQESSGAGCPQIASHQRHQLALAARRTVCGSTPSSCLRRHRRCADRRRGRRARRSRNIRG